MDSCIILLPIHHTQEYVLVMDSCYTSLKCSYFPSTVLIFTNKVCIEIKKEKVLGVQYKEKVYMYHHKGEKKDIYKCVGGRGEEEEKRKGNNILAFVI